MERVLEGRRLQDLATLPILAPERHLAWNLTCGL